MKRWRTLAILIVLLPGCATQLAIRPLSSSDADAASARQVLLFQNSAIAPGHDVAPLHPDRLQRGDILLTSGPGLISASIQLVTLAPVSHAAIYIGDGRIVEAVRPAVQVRTLDEFLAEGHVVLAYRYPELSAGQARNISQYALQKSGSGFNFLGVTLHVPLAVTRRVCELPLVPSPVRDACIRSFGLMNYLAPSERRLFCSQLVLEAYRQSGVPITDADPRLISPADILHMREGDVPSVRTHKRLRYLGHLKYQLPSIVARDH